MAYYPNLVAEMAKRKITKKELTECIGVQYRTLRRKVDGETPFTWPEARRIRHKFFPDMEYDDLFATADETQRNT